ncbi:ribosomal protein S18 acetylase RimI-like enzyme [Methanofollis sp. W23]|uniref:GNAT family N-acetyltransferase n=1 Tax=Methanofollis sp. W23 TaxID=2817849 RepID=UPI001AE714B3|nr:GNAT family N-acetyltransferase [Methanofollis sp. W23]MBP2144821.1 ribosomal protein S18 acetylase RimI-like enzyme [Methanofollis sp. W23]
MLSGITLRTVRAWDAEEIVGLYRAGEWWKEEWTAHGIPPLIKGSFCFVVAVDRERAVGMGRAISDGCSDAYLQDIIVLPEYRGYGIGDAIVKTLVTFCTSHGLTWIGLIAQPGTVAFYQRHGFARMTGHVPMLLREEDDLY